VQGRWSISIQRAWGSIALSQPLPKSQAHSQTSFESGWPLATSPAFLDLTPAGPWYQCATALTQPCPWQLNSKFISASALPDPQLNPR
jgi:hypothetical protein